MMKSILYVSALLGAFRSVHTGMNLNSAQNIAVYWGIYPFDKLMQFQGWLNLAGQNSINLASGSTAQQRLSYYCESMSMIVAMMGEAYANSYSP